MCLVINIVLDPVAKQLNILLFDNLLYLYTACLMYKVFNNECCDVARNLFCSVRNVHSLNNRASSLIWISFVPPCSLTLKQNFNAFLGILLLNSLTDDLRLCKFLKVFKKKLILNAYCNYFQCVSSLFCSLYLFLSIILHLITFMFIMTWPISITLRRASYSYIIASTSGHFENFLNKFQFQFPMNLLH